jgi:hypothetical protein
VPGWIWLMTIFGDGKSGDCGVSSTDPAVVVFEPKNPAAASDNTIKPKKYFFINYS